MREGLFFVFKYGEWVVHSAQIHECLPPKSQRSRGECRWRGRSMRTRSANVRVLAHVSSVGCSHLICLQPLCRCTIRVTTLVLPWHWATVDLDRHSHQSNKSLRGPASKTVCGVRDQGYAGHRSKCQRRPELLMVAGWSWLPKNETEQNKLVFFIPNPLSPG